MKNLKSKVYIYDEKNTFGSPDLSIYFDLTSIWKHIVFKTVL